MRTIDSIRAHIAKSQMDKAFDGTKRLLKSLPDKRVSRKFLDAVQSLEYQYNNLQKEGHERLSAEQVHVLKNRVITGFFVVLTEFELITVQLTPAEKQLKKLQLVTEININHECKHLANAQTQRIQQNESTPNQMEVYLSEKIEQLEKIHKKILRANRVIAVPISLYFIVQMIQLYMKWEHDHEPAHLDYPGTSSYFENDEFWDGAILQHLLLSSDYDHSDHGGSDDHGFHSMDSGLDHLFDDHDSDASSGGDDD